MEKQKDKILIVDDVELNRAILCELLPGTTKYWKQITAKRL